MSNEKFVPNEVLRLMNNQRIDREQKKDRIAQALGVKRTQPPKEGMLIDGGFQQVEKEEEQEDYRDRQKLHNPYKETEELVIAAKALVSWFYSSDLPVEEKLALRNNVFREIAALNRYIAEIQGIGADTKIDSTPPYTEWFKMPEALERMVKEKQERKNR